MASKTKGSAKKSHQSSTSSSGSIASHPHADLSTEDTGSLTTLDAVKSERQNRAWNTMRWFKGVPGTEIEFYARFEAMPLEDATFLKSFYSISDDWDLFRMICKFWNVRVSDVRPRTTVKV